MSKTIFTDDIKLFMQRVNISKVQFFRYKRIVGGSLEKIEDCIKEKRLNRNKQSTKNLLLTYNHKKHLGLI